MCRAAAYVGFVCHHKEQDRGRRERRRREEGGAPGAHVAEQKARREGRGWKPKKLLYGRRRNYSMNGEGQGSCRENAAAYVPLVLVGLIGATEEAARARNSA
jgi:hypothetical protein